ncbi:Callisulfakinin like protein [Argiope bruennichi]|uniref:Callisulfakinin like protein n=2 Tax=Argiope bruennichi TaxID=94029 RepID=A0A8T0E6D7_ARGBR|nr:Callisulfakinin like protein [Argiope bruennichi]
MKHVKTICLVLVVLHLSAAAYPSSQIQRLARLVMPYVGGNHHSLALARSLDASSSLARRHNDDSSQDVGATDFEDEDVDSVSKRQFDDYGHMRFGRNAGVPHKKFDDYGHMRYGK